MIRRYGKSWGFDYYPDGRSGPRIRRRGFKTRIEAAGVLRKIQKGERVSRRLSSLVDIWYKLHGQSLKDAKYRLSLTLAIVDRLGNPDIYDFTASDWAEYRAERLNKVTPSTVNHEQRYLSAVLAEMVRMGHIPTNPIANVRQIKVSETELTFLSLDQCRQLLDECKASSNPHCYAVALICLATGARWGEAERLTWSAILPGKILFKGESTKTGKSRAVPISDDVLSQITALADPAPGRLFKTCRDAFRSAYKRTGFNTPQQQTHILRHTFASHYMMNGGDILSLQRILGHGNITMTMRYAHLSPDHLSSVLKLGVISRLNSVN